MAKNIKIVPFSQEDSAEWDQFILKNSLNGTFLQTRRFLSYHPKGRFEDCSLMVKKGDSCLAVIPACRQVDGDEVVFNSHGGATFGGMIVDKRAASAAKAIQIVQLMDEWLRNDGFTRAVMKQTPAFFSRSDTSSVEYALQHEGYSAYSELSFVIDFSQYESPVECNFTSSRRRDCRYGEKAGCTFRELSSDDDIKRFYKILELSLNKFDVRPVHSLNELLDFKNNRLKEQTRFFGVEYAGELIAGSMVFLFEADVFHTQYLAADPNHLDVFPMNYLDWNLIRVAKEEGFKRFSFGISTEEHGRVLNESLATFKEGFGGIHSLNWTYSKVLCEQENDDGIK